MYRARVGDIDNRYYHSKYCKQILYYGETRSPRINVESATSSSVQSFSDDGVNFIVITCVRVDFSGLLSFYFICYDNIIEVTG